jgi:hypothetical protein
MRDPLERVSPNGTTVTRASRDRVPADFEAVLTAASELVGSHAAEGSLSEDSSGTAAVIGR